MSGLKHFIFCYNEAADLGVHDGCWPVLPSLPDGQWLGEAGDRGGKLQNWILIVITIKKFLKCYSVWCLAAVSSPDKKMKGH